MIDGIYRLSRWTAVVGGVVLVALMLMVVASVAGRALIGVGLAPVPGDFELVEVGVGIAVFFFCRGATCAAVTPRWTCFTCTRRNGRSGPSTS